MDWANDPETRASAFQGQVITPEEHAAWLCGRLSDPAQHRLYLVESETAEPIGQVRFDQQPSGVWALDYAVAPVLRGRGFGREVLAAGLAAFRQDVPSACIHAEVKAENLRSQRVLEGLGFQVQVLSYVLRCADLDRMESRAI